MSKLNASITRDIAYITKQLTLDNRIQASKAPDLHTYDHAVLKVNDIQFYILDDYDLFIRSTKIITTIINCYLTYVHTKAQPSFTALYSQKL